MSIKCSSFTPDLFHHPSPLKILTLAIPSITSNHDGAHLYYRDYVPADSPQPYRKAINTSSKTPALLFSSAWPFSSRMWDHLLVPLSEIHRYRCIAPDRRGYGNSEWSGISATASPSINYDVFASDLLQVMDSAPALSASVSSALALALDGESCCLR